MKLKIGDTVYLQKYEVAYITHELVSYPSSIFQEMFGDEDGLFSMDYPVDRFHFACVFKRPENVKWLMEQDWFVDYDEYAKKPLSELIALMDCLNEEYYASIDEFNAKDAVYRKKHLGDIEDKLNKLSHKAASIGDLIMFRKGRVEFVFPDEYSRGAQ